MSTTTHPFLSPEWVQAARGIGEEFKERAAGVVPTVRMNQIITGVPFGDGTLNAHIDSSSGEMVVDLGHVDAPEVTVSLPYEVARAIFVYGDSQAAMQAFLSGHIKVDGDLTKLMVMQAALGGEGEADAVAVALELQQRLKEITAD